MSDNRFTFAVQRLPTGPSYAESFPDQPLYEVFIEIFLCISFLLELVQILV